ncbi:MAG: ATP-binding protein [Verrucomicrobiia bacterium]
MACLRREKGYRLGMGFSGDFWSALRENKLLAGVNEEVLREVAMGWEVVEVAGGETIFEEGSEGSSLFLVLSGAVAISKRGRGDRQERLGVLGPGDFFGEMSVIDRGPRSARAEATMGSALVEVDEGSLRRLLGAGDGEVGFNLVRGTVERLRGANEHFIEELRREERLSAIGSMAGGIVHDFKNPMSAIVGCCDLLMVRYPEPGVRELVEIMQRATWMMLGMTQDLLDFAKGKVRLGIEVGSWMRFAGVVEEQVLRPLRDDGYRVEVEAAVEGEVRLDFDRMVRVLGNLLKNAREASARRSRLVFRAWREGQVLVMQVEDEGRGIPPELMGRLFQPFVTEGKADGTGLGLAMAKSVVEGHGGRIEVASEVGRGTIFTVRLPQEEGGGGQR